MAAARAKINNDQGFGCSCVSQGTGKARTCAGLSPLAEPKRLQKSPLVRSRCRHTYAVYTSRADLRGVD